MISAGYKSAYQQGYEDCRQAVLALAKEECDTAIIPYRKFVKDINALSPATTQKSCDTCKHCEREGGEQ